MWGPRGPVSAKPGLRGEGAGGTGAPGWKREKTGAQVRRGQTSQWGHGQGAGAHTGPGNVNLGAAGVDAALQVTGLEEIPRE